LVVDEDEKEKKKKGNFRARTMMMREQGESGSRVDESSVCYTHMIRSSYHELIASLDQFAQ
jgi:hypothetical protein